MPEKLCSSTSATFKEPGCAIDVKKSVAEKFDFEPDIYDKVYVNGPDAEPLFQFLKEKQGGFLVDAIKWNFTKFLVDLNGQPVSLEFFFVLTLFGIKLSNLPPLFLP